MSTPSRPSRTRSDPDLIAAARRGDRAAYDELFRRHEPAIRRLAALVAGSRRDVEDLTLHTYTAVLQALDSGDGPRVAFRTFALVNLLGAPSIGSSPESTPVAAYGYEAMPEEWQAALWHAEVERDSPAGVGDLLGLTSTDVVGLTARARAAIRQYAAAGYLADVEAPYCRATAEHLAASPDGGFGGGFLGGSGGGVGGGFIGGFAAGGSWDDPGRRHAVQVRAHLDRCERCETFRVRLAALDERLGLVLARALLHEYAAGYLDSATAPDRRLPASVRLRRLINGSYRNLAAAAVVGALTLALAGWGLLAAVGTTGPVAQTRAPSVPHGERHQEERGEPDGAAAPSLLPTVPSTGRPIGPRGHWLRSTTGRSRIALPPELEPRQSPVWLDGGRLDHGRAGQRLPGNTSVAGTVSPAPTSAMPGEPPITPPLPPTLTAATRDQPDWAGPVEPRTPATAVPSAPVQASPESGEIPADQPTVQHWERTSPGMSSSTTRIEERTTKISPNQPNVEQGPAAEAPTVPLAPGQWYRRVMPWNWLGGGGHSGQGAPDQPGVQPAANGEPAAGGAPAARSGAAPAQGRKGPGATEARGFGHDRTLHIGPGLAYGRHFGGYRY